ncbi:MAG: hypothetical protein HJJLKODD_02275 [Phycisphaerae bacterium]|nr:hypothetical protein [Phycisphaerae bacterium]
MFATISRRRRLFLCSLLLGWAGCFVLPAMAQNNPPANPLQKKELKTSAFDQYVTGGGWITYFVLIPLSFLMTGLSIEHFLNIRRGTLMPDELKASLVQLIQERRYKEVVETTAQHPSMLAGVIHAGLTQANSGLAAMERAMEEVLELRAAVLFRHIEYLNVIANVSPMIGLFGTVVGMIQVFSTIKQMGGQPDAVELAGGIAVALITTFWGLLIAIPALSIFHIMRNRIDALLAECAEEAEQLLQVFRPMGRGGLTPVKETPKKPAAAEPSGLVGQSGTPSANSPA